MASRIVLVLISTYFLDNIKIIDKGVSLSLLAWTALLLPFLWRFLEPRYGRPRVSSSFLLCVLFIGYAALKMFADELDAYSLFQNTLGTTGGIVFAFALGVVVSAGCHGLSTLSGTTPRESLRSFRAPVFDLLSAGWILFLSLSAFFEHYRNLRPDILLVEGLAESYQRPGAMAIMQGITNLLLCNVALVNRGRPSFVAKISWLLLLASNLVLLVLCQMIGSNAGTVGLASITGSYSLVNFLFLRPRPERAQGSPRIFYSVSALRVYLLSACVGLLAVSVIVFTDSFEAYTRKLRVFGFGDDTISSLTSRIDLLERNLLPQLAFDPLFGHSRVEFFTTGEGTYQHNLLSIWTHLGLVGFVLFGVLIAMALLGAWNRLHRSIATGECSRSALTLLLLLLVVLPIASLFTFFTWMPLWFLLGMTSTWRSSVESGATGTPREGLDRRPRGFSTLVSDTTAVPTGVALRGALEATP